MRSQHASWGVFRKIWLKKQTGVTQKQILVQFKWRWTTLEKFADWSAISVLDHFRNRFPWQERTARPELSTFRFCGRPHSMCAFACSMVWRPRGWHSMQHWRRRWQRRSEQSCLTWLRWQTPAGPSQNWHRWYDTAHAPGKKREGNRSVRQSSDTDGFISAAVEKQHPHLSWPTASSALSDAEPAR